MLHSLRSRLIVLLALALLPASTTGMTTLSTRRALVRSRSRLASVAGGTILALSLAACGGGGETTSDEPAQGATSEEATDTSPTEPADVHNDADTEFAQMMIVHHEGAIEMADLMDGLS